MNILNIQVIKSTEKEFSCNFSGENVNAKLDIFLDKAPTGIWILASVIEYFFMTDYDVNLFDKFNDDVNRVTWSRAVDVKDGQGYGQIKLFRGYTGETVNSEQIELFTIQISKLIEGITAFFLRAKQGNKINNFRSLK